MSTDFKRPTEPQRILFAKIEAGGYFNLSSALLKKFSLFEFRVHSDTANLYVLDGRDLISQSKKSEDLYYALQSHAILYEVDGQKYDFNRPIRKVEVFKNEEEKIFRKKEV